MQNIGILNSSLLVVYYLVDFKVNVVNLIKFRTFRDSIDVNFYTFTL